MASVVGQSDFANETIEASEGTRQEFKLRRLPCATFHTITSKTKPRTKPIRPLLNPPFQKTQTRLRGKRKLVVPLGCEKTFHGLVKPQKLSRT